MDNDSDMQKIIMYTTKIDQNSFDFEFIIFDRSIRVIGCRR